MEEMDGSRRGEIATREKIQFQRAAPDRRGNSGGDEDALDGLRVERRYGIGLDIPLAHPQK
jgi:hypothetical protein